jgi:formylmethanofuran dehydrogenase subunit E
MSDELKLRKSEVERTAETLYVILEKQECGADKTQHIRGQIAGLRTALRLAGYELALAPVVRPIPKAPQQRAAAGDDELRVPLY